MEVFTTGYVNWRTKIPVPTIQRYIKKYSGYFSEGARVPSKSRRYTEKDIRKLMILRKLNQSHASDGEISAALNGDIPEAALPFTEFENVIQIAEAARRAEMEAEKSAQRASEYLEDIDRRFKYRDNQYFEMRNEVRRLTALVQKLDANIKVALHALEEDGLIEKDMAPRPQEKMVSPVVETKAIDGEEEFPKTGIGWLDRTMDKLDRWSKED